MTPRKKILLIDDDESILLAVSRVLTVSGFDVVSAPGGVPGLEMVGSAQPDAVVCDVNMPDMEGFEVLRRVRADPATVSLPFILLTSADERENVRKAMQMGADDFISKPFLASEITVKALTLALRRRLEAQRDKENMKETTRSAGPLLVV